MSPNIIFCKKIEQIEKEKQMVIVHITVCHNIHM